MVTEFDKSADSTTVLDHAVSEARLRKAPLRVLTSWRPGFNDIHDTHASAEGSRQAKATLERSLTRYRRLYPEVEIKAVAVTGSPMNYLARHAESIRPDRARPSTQRRTVRVHGPGRLRSAERIELLGVDFRTAQRTMTYHRHDGQQIDDHSSVGSGERTTATAGRHGGRLSDGDRLPRR